MILGLKSMFSHIHNYVQPNNKVIQVELSLLPNKVIKVQLDLLPNKVIKVQ